MESQVDKDEDKELYEGKEYSVLALIQEYLVEDDNESNDDIENVNIIENEFNNVDEDNEKNSDTRSNYVEEDNDYETTIDNNRPRR